MFLFVVKNTQLCSKNLILHVLILLIMINRVFIPYTLTSYFSRLTHYLPNNIKQLTKFGQARQEDRVISVLLVDDHPLVRQWTRRIIEDQTGMKVIGEVTNGEEAIKASREWKPDVILMDINMPVMGGIEATRRITAEMPDISVIGLSTHDENEIVQEMKDAGASAYLTKSEAFETLIVTIRREVSCTGRVG